MFPASFRRVLIAAFLTLPGLMAVGCSTQTPGQSFATPDQAVSALVEAIGPPVNHAKLETILGSEGREIADSGDPVADAQNAETFVNRYREQHRFETQPDGSVELIVGKNQWPMPILLVKDEKGMWSFDTAEGKEEILRRRIGANELWTMNVLLAIVEAQREYSRLDPDGNGQADYASRIVSEQGKRNGLYWPTAEGEAPSPMGEMVADAAHEGYGGGAGARAFHGYRYRLLTAQGSAAPGGEMPYTDKSGRLLTGFGVVAWPATYGNSGIMTFIVSADGVVHEKDLGEGTDTIARAMTAYNPGDGWKKSEVPAEVPDAD